MKKLEIAGVEIEQVSITKLLFSKEMFIAYILLAIGLFGVYEVLAERYFSFSANAFDAGTHIGSSEVAQAMKEAIFGAGGEVKREEPWTIYIANYMYMIYSGSGIIFLVALAELFDIAIIKKTAAGFMTLGLCIVFGGLFTIVMDLNVLHMLAMFSSPNIDAGMWLMLPLYSIYIPFVMFEIYLLLTNKKEMVKKIAKGILILSVFIDIIEYYIQAKLFDMNTARHLWTTYPNLTLYFIVSAFVAACGIMLIYSFITYRKTLGEEFGKLTTLLKKTTLVMIIALGAYEALAFLFIDKNWASVILFGSFKYDFYIYMFFTMVLPFGLLAFKLYKKELTSLVTILASISLIVGTYIGRMLFVYGGNAYPMSDRFGTGFEKYSEYEVAKEFVFFAPSIHEVAIVIGSIGVVILAYSVINKYLSVSKIRDEH